MKYLIVGIAALLAGECALAQTPAPAEPAKKSAATQPAPATGSAAAKDVGTKDRTVEADAYLKAQEKKRAAMAKNRAAKGADAKPGARSKSDAEGAVRPGSLMTEEERTAHRNKLHSFKTLDECQKYQQDYQAKIEARAKEQKKTLRPFNDAACNRYKVAADKAAPAAAKPATK
jgi:hypothetical protein